MTIAFLDALVNANLVPESLASDSQHVYCVLKAETSPLDEFTRSLTLLSSLMGSKSGTKKDGDSKEFLGWINSYH